MKTVTFLLLTLLLSLPLTLAAKTVLISDIDDTLKTARVHSPFHLILHSFLGNNRFIGMSEFLQMLAIEKADMRFYYVTNASKRLMKHAHSRFLRKGNFPTGALFLRSESRKTHKIKTITKILRLEKPEQVILIGDNGGPDVKFYNHISRLAEFSHIKFYQFIRQVYAKSRDHKVSELKERQTGFSTPVEIALTLMEAKFLKQGFVEDLLALISEPIINETHPHFRQPQAFPKWAHCDDLAWPWISLENKISNLRPLREKVFKRCNL